MSVYVASAAERGKTSPPYNFTSTFFITHTHTTHNTEGLIETQHIKILKHKKHKDTSENKIRSLKMFRSYLTIGRKWRTTKGKDYF